MARLRNSDARSLQIILGLGTLGLFLSLYLVREHYSGGEGKSACDFAEHISCTAVLSSEWAELFSIPIAVLGVTWNLVLILLCVMAYQVGSEVKAEEKEGKYTSMKSYIWISAILVWVAAGIGFVVYLLVAELILGAICPLCTIIHIFTIVEFYFSWKLFNNQTASASISIDDVIDTFKYWILVIALLHIVILIFFNLPTPEITTLEENEELAKCLSENKVFMFGSPKCSHCISQKKIFGDAFEYIHFVNCEEEATECTKREIDGFPTWIQFDANKEMVISRIVGTKTISGLRKAFPQCAPKVTPPSSQS